MPRPQTSTAEREVGSRPLLGAVGIIPARLQSTRLPNKPLQDLGGAPLIVRVLERVRMAGSIREAWVATDSPQIVEIVEAAGGRAILTRAEHLSGLDRVAEAAHLLAPPGSDPDEVIVNVQGDEPFVSAAGIEAMVQLFERREVDMATIAAPFQNRDDVEDPNRVKVVLDRNGRALYFSRAAIPTGYGPVVEPLLHVGVYAYRRRTLERLALLPPAPIERAERLEQLRALWNGIQIDVAVADYSSFGIDTPEDLAEARARWEEWRRVT
ncbi:MAG: 3-deoxy-manno-octulosonate cytidylyltransferase [Candidatus Eiseniibacteriota bacterium]